MKAKRVKNYLYLGDHINLLFKLYTDEMAFCGTSGNDFKRYQISRDGRVYDVGLSEFKVSRIIVIGESMFVVNRA